jgi:hypothetical protein
MDEIDFGGGGSVTIEGDYGTDFSSMAPGGPNINLPDFGNSAEAPSQLNQQFLTQLPNLSSNDFSSLPDAPVLMSGSQKLIEQQQNISKETQDLINLQPQIQNSYQQYQQTYNANLPLYNKSMQNYNGFMNAYNFNMQQGYGDVGYMSRSASSSLKLAEKYKQNINDSATAYETIVNDYNTNLENVKNSLSDYQTNYKQFQDEVTNSKASLRTPAPVTEPPTPTPPNAPPDAPVTGTSPTPVTTPTVPGTGDVNIPTPPTITPPIKEPVAPDLPEITVTPPVDPKEPVAPDLPEITVTPPSDEPQPKPPEEKPPVETPPTKPPDDFTIEINPLFPPEKGTLPNKKNLLSKTLGTDKLLSTLLGTSLASSPTSAEPYLLGTDEKVKNVWNTDSLRNALGI